MMSDLSPARMLRIVLVLGLSGAAIIWILKGPANATGFLAGAALAWLTVRSWGNLAQGLGGKEGRPPLASAWILALRYLVIAGALYATIKILGSSPVATILGLLVSFASVLVELLYGSIVSRNEFPQVK